MRDTLPLSSCRAQTAEGLESADQNRCLGFLHYSLARAHYPRFAPRQEHANFANVGQR